MALGLQARLYSVVRHGQLHPRIARDPCFHLFRNIIMLTAHPRLPYYCLLSILLKSRVTINMTFFPNDCSIMITSNTLRYTVVKVKIGNYVHTVLCTFNVVCSYDTNSCFLHE